MKECLCVCVFSSFQATHVYDLLSLARPELRLRDLMGAFNSWKESIINAELIHQEEETKLRLSTEHPHSYYMTESVLQASEKFSFEFPLRKKKHKFFNDFL